MTRLTAVCQSAISRKFSSMTQSNSSPGRALWASLRAGSAWIRSPRDVSLMSRTLLIFPRKQPFQECAEAMPLQVALASFLGSDVVELDGAPLALERLVSVPAVRGNLENQAASGVGRYLGGIASQVVVVVEEPEPPLGRAPAAVQVEQDRHELRLRIGVNAAVLLSRAAANREHGRSVLQIHAQALADQVPQLDAVQLLHERRETARARNRFRRKAAALVDPRKALDHLSEDFGANEVVDDEIGEGLRDERGFAERAGVQHFPGHGHRRDSIPVQC